jgi:dTMP kinase
VKKLNKEGQSSFVTKEPTNNIVGGLLRGLLTKEWETSSEGFQLLFAADRAHHLKREILPAVESGKIVVSDRYFFSTIAFGSIDLPREWLEQLNSRFPIPEITFLIKVSPKVCLERIGKAARPGLEFFEEQEKLEKTWQTYESLASDPKNKIRIIDGERPVEVIEKEIFDIVKEII